MTLQPMDMMGIFISHYEIVIGEVTECCVVLSTVTQWKSLLEQEVHISQFLKYFDSYFNSIGFAI